MIQKLVHEDLNNVHELQPPDWGDMLPHLNFYINSPFCFPIKLIADNKIISIGTTIIHNDVAWLAHIIVHPEYRNKGIGKIMTQALVNSINTTVCSTIYLIATELGEPVYHKIGFEIESEYLFFKEGITPVDHSPELRIKQFDEQYRSEIIILDTFVSGENRERHLNEHLSDALVFIAANKVEGYYLPTFGDGLIIAGNPTAGIELMKLRLKKKDYAILPIENEIAINFLLDRNFKEFRRGKRMRLGLKRPWHPTHIYNRVSGQIG